MAIVLARVYISLENFDLVFRDLCRLSISTWYSRRRMTAFTSTIYGLGNGAPLIGYIQAVLRNICAA